MVDISSLAPWALHARDAEPWTSAGVAIAALWLALAIDRWLGEPPTRWHPVVWIGSYLGAVARFVAPLAGQGGKARWRPFTLGAIAWCVGAALVVVAAWTVQWHVSSHLPAWCAALVMALALKPLLAWQMLRNEVSAVESALGQSLAAGRAQLARLVSRDVDQLDRSGVRESAIESLAENLNDSLVAPVFWFVVAGLPGAALYRFANTADAMWGYRGERSGRDWTWAGKWAARADDVLSWVPARITAVLLCGVALLDADGPRWPRGVLRREAARTPSPNSGWPMAAMAMLLGIRLGKPGVYVLNEDGRVPMRADLHRAIAFGSRAVMACVLFASIALASLAWLRTA